MGSSPSKHQKDFQQVNVPTFPLNVEKVQPSPSQYVYKEQTPPQSLVHLIQTRPSTKHSMEGITNGHSRRTPLLEFNINSKRRESDQISLPSIHSRNTKLASQHSVRTSSVVRPPSISRTRLSPSPVNRNNSIASEKPVGRCAFCPHCQENAGGKCLGDDKPKWIVDEPKNGIMIIEMKEYDTVAVREKVLPRKGHLRGEYDYQPQLTIGRIDEDEETTGKYCTQTLVAKTKPKISPVRTPFPDYELFQLRDYHSNKIYSLPSYDN